MNFHKLSRSWIPVVTVILFLTFASAFAFADTLSMVLTSSGAGTFTYDVSNPGGADFTMASASLTGLSGVTGATFVPGSDWDFLCNGLFACSLSFTSSSVTFTSTNILYRGFTTVGSFVVDSPAPLGTVDYGIQSSFGNFSGTVGGPVAPIPEPSSLLMLGSGVLGLAVVIRRKLSV